MHRFPLLLLFCSLTATLKAEDGIEYNRDIRPILSDKCFACHGPDNNTREAKLRLDVRADALAAEAFIPGDADKSELIFRIFSNEEDDVMPPPEENRQLTAAERELLKRWIEQGAEYQEHWSFLPVERPSIAGAIDGPAAIDHFVDQRLAEEKLERSPGANAVTLARRLNFDLTGLPPVSGDVARLRQHGIEAYVDALLASPHFGERMAIEWLDAVRYADSVGYHGAQEREASPFRDYVIDSFNANKPFDQFTIEQIAGDLLPDATLWQKVAAGYNRLNQISREGGIQDAEYLAKYQAERVRTTTSAWMGVTLACAECHDHKFDPFSAKDFYSFAAFFADILEKGAWNGDGSFQEDESQYAGDGIVFDTIGPKLEVPTAEESERIQHLNHSLNEQREQLQKTTPELEARAAGWAANQRVILNSDAPRDFVYLSEKGDKNEVGTRGWTFVDAAGGKVHRGSVARQQKADGLIQHLADASKKPLELIEGDVFFTYVWLDPDNPPTQVMLQFNPDGKDWSHRAYWGADDIPFGKGADGEAHRKRGALPKVGEWVRLEVPIAEVGFTAGDKVSHFAFTQFGGLAYWDESGIHTLNEKYRADGLSDAMITVVQKPEAERSAVEKRMLLDHYRATAAELKPLRDEVAKLENQLKTAKAVVRTVPATVSAKRREIRVLPRGDWMDKSGPVVTAAPPHFLPHSESMGTSRLDLARWMVARDNPLTARTFVNRIWARLFGSGLSGVLNDLGSQGEWPTHPQLLDWLAAEFMDSGWDVKHLMRTIVLSEAYRQSSQSSPELDEIDPYNRLLAHQSQIRLPAELIRDNALAVSGLLNPQIGGRSARPYQPAGYYQHLNFPRREYQPDTNDSQYRRGVYTHWQRTFLHPALMAFDAPARDECTMDRPYSNTPLQALNLLNDPSYVEAARALAENSKSVSDAFERVLSRLPTREEKSVLEQVLAVELTRISADPEAVESLLGVGLKAPSEVSADVAAMTAVARVILNLHETITRY